MLVLPHADLSIDGSVTIAGERLELSATPGAQAHLWGSKHAGSWVWAHCNDLRTVDGERVPDSFIDGVSVMVPRFGRQIGPSTPVVGRLHGSDFTSTSPTRVIANHSTFALTGWRFEAFDGPRKLVGEVDSYRDQIVGVTYHDPDGEPAYCYNSETATMRLHVYERARQVGGWRLRETFVAARPRALRIRPAIAGARHRASHHVTPSAPFYAVRRALRRRPRRRARRVHHPPRRLLIRALRVAQPRDG